MKMDQDYIQILKLNGGSKQAFVALYNKYVGRILSYVRQMLRDESLAEDITQFCFMKVWEHRKDIRPDANFAAYIYIIARNEVFKETRRMMTSASYLDFLTHQSQTLPDTISQQVDYHTLESEIAKVIDKLPDSRKRIYLMSTQQLMTNSEIACQLNISPKTVEAQIGRVVSALRKHLSRFI